MNKSPMLGSWYKYDNDIVNLVKFVKGNTNSMLMDFQKTASILFYCDVKYVAVCYNNLCNSNEVIDLMRQEHPPIILVQLQDATLSSLSRNTSSLSSSNTLSSLSSDNSSRSLTSVRLITRTMIVFFHLHLNQQKMARATQVKSNVPIMFSPFAIGLWVQYQKVATITHIKNGV